jgi:hypothetical protein
MALAVTTTGAAPEPCDGTVQLTSQSNFQDDKALFCDQICAGLGMKEEALPHLVPITKDALVGVDFAIDLAQIYAWTGEKDLAIEQIEIVQRFPNPLSYGVLKLHPHWDSLRGDPRFEKLAASLAPK